MNLIPWLLFIHATASTTTLSPTDEIFNSGLVEGAFVFGADPTIKLFLDEGMLEEALNISWHQLEVTRDQPTFDDLSAIVAALKTRVNVLRSECQSLSVLLSTPGRVDVDRLRTSTELESMQSTLERMCTDVRTVLTRALALKRYTSETEAAEYHVAIGDFTRYIIEQNSSRHDLHDSGVYHYRAGIEMYANCVITLRGYNGLALLIKTIDGDIEAARYMEEAIKNANILVARTLMTRECSIEEALYYKELIAMMQHNLDLWRPGDDWIVV